jgi:hypothetical protein
MGKLVDDGRRDLEGRFFAGCRDFNDIPRSEMIPGIVDAHPVDARRAHAINQLGGT